MNIKHRITTSAVAMAAVMALAGSAGAAVLNFVAEAAGNERAIADGDFIVMDGLKVTFSAGPGGAGADYAYLDDLSGGKPAGLGVCTNLTGTQCNPSSDDNISAESSVAGQSEWVTLSFDSVLTSFSVTSFYDADHNSLATSTDTLLINGDEYTFANALITDFGGSDMIEFAYGGDSANQFYVGGAIATIPLPAAGFLLLGGLGGLVVARRRRKAA